MSLTLSLYQKSTATLTLCYLFSPRFLRLSSVLVSPSIYTLFYPFIHLPSPVISPFCSYVHFLSPYLSFLNSFINYFHLFLLILSLSSYIYALSHTCLPDNNKYFFAYVHFKIQQGWLKTKTKQKL